MTEGQQYSVSYEEGPVWVTTADGPVALEYGDAVPENVHPNEVARLANAGLLEGIAQAPELSGTLDANDPAPDPAKLPDGDVDEIKTRVGSDPETAQAYLDAEQGRTRTRKGLVAHLEGVIAAGRETTDPGAPSPVDGTSEG